MAQRCTASGRVLALAALAALAVVAATQQPAEPRCRLAVVVAVGEGEVGLLHATVGALAPVPDDVSVLLLDVAGSHGGNDARAGCARTDSDTQCGHAPERRPTIELVASRFPNVVAASADPSGEPAAALAAAAVGSGCEHSLFLSHAVLLQDSLASFSAQLLKPLGKPLPPLPPSAAVDAATISLGASDGPIGVVGAKLVRSDGTIAHAGFSFVPTARPPPPTPPPPPYGGSSYSSNYGTGDWSSFDSVDYAPSYRVGGLDSQKKKKKKKKKKTKASSYTSWRDAEPLSLDDGLGLGGLDDYLLGDDDDDEQEGEEDEEDEVDDEDDLRLYGYLDEEEDYGLGGGGVGGGSGLLESLSNGLSELSSGLAATVAGTDSAPPPPPPPPKKRPKATAVPYHRLGGMPGTHPAASGELAIGVPAVSAQALLIKTATLAEATAAIGSSSSSTDGNTVESSGDDNIESVEDDDDDDKIGLGAGGRERGSDDRDATGGGSGDGHHGKAHGGVKPTYSIDGSVDWTKWGVELGFSGLCLALRRAGYAVALQPSAVATLLPGGGGSSSSHGNGGVPPHSVAAAASFRDAFDETLLLPALTSNYMLQGKVGVLYSMECGSPETLGFTMEALGFVLALRHVLPIKLEVREWSTCERNVLAEQPAVRKTPFWRLFSNQNNNDHIVLVK
jgi:hypothetical protein